MFAGFFISLALKFFVLFTKTKVVPSRREPTPPNADSYVSSLRSISDSPFNSNFNLLNVVFMFKEMS